LPISGLILTIFGEKYAKNARIKYFNPQLAYSWRKTRLGLLSAEWCRFIRRRDF